MPKEMRPPQPAILKEAVNEAELPCNHKGDAMPTSSEKCVRNRGPASRASTKGCMKRCTAGPSSGTLMTLHISSIVKTQKATAKLSRMKSGSSKNPGTNIMTAST
mmetsp:Transcript_19333/g.37031  ORF Transcript_19333/g.37031 Transcript_19333/m.37031 type:complete len:105 (-) Transcript_19333:439-753(-)